MDSKNYSVKRFADIADLEKQNHDAVFRTPHPDSKNKAFREAIAKYEAVGKFPYIKIGFTLEPFKESKHVKFSNRGGVFTIYFLKPELVDTLNKLGTNIEATIKNYEHLLETSITLTAYTDGQKIKPTDSSDSNSSSDTK